MRKNGNVVLLANKIVDETLMTGTDDALRKFVNEFSTRFGLGKAVRVPKTLWFYGMNHTQRDEFSVKLWANDNLNGIEP